MMPWQPTFHPGQPFFAPCLSGVSRERRQKARTHRPGQPASASAGYEVRSPA